MPDNALWIFPAPTPVWIIARRDVRSDDNDWHVTGFWFCEQCPSLEDTAVLDDIPVGEIPHFDIAVFRNHHGKDFRNPDNFERRARRFQSCGPRHLVPGAALRGFINAFDSGWF